MKRIILAAILAMASLVAAADGQNPVITMRLYNRAGVPQETLFKAVAEAQRIFAEADARLEWWDCPVTVADENRVPTCLESWRTTEVAMRILPGLSQKYGGRELGYSVPSADGGALANVYYERARDLSRKELSPEGCTLGHAIAHELGHLLLRGMSHSSSGIMRAEWNIADLQAATAGQLNFTQDQAAAIQVEVHRRTLLKQQAEEQKRDVALTHRR